MNRFAQIACAVTMTILVAACGGDDSTDSSSGGTSGGTTSGGTSGSPATDAGPGAATPTTVTIASNSFSPARVTVKKGATVRWTWTAPGHNVVSGTACASDGKFTSGNPSAGPTFERTFDETGTFDYFCAPHCAMGMTGQVTVE